MCAMMCKAFSHLALRSRLLWRKLCRILHVYIHVLTGCPSNMFCQLECPQPCPSLLTYQDKISTVNTYLLHANARARDSVALPGWACVLVHKLGSIRRAASPPLSSGDALAPLPNNRSQRFRRMVKETLCWLFGYRRCESCFELSNAGWFDNDGCWYCEECQMNCVLDLFADEPVPAESWLQFSLRKVRQLPGSAASQLITCGCELVKAGGHVGLLGGQLLLVTSGAALRLACGKGSPPPGKATEEDRQKALADFEEPWVVVVVGGSFMPGDPVEVCTKGAKGWRGIVKAKTSEGFYTVEDESHKTHKVSSENLKVDSLTAPAL
ncbi:unnamed protein product [Durusdinium trenchii]|uniref:Uncharacterized protein n=1 Tax=Durusdinium trenchii TaxID=1381693 RepID=A0ABP0PNY0_9DINO